MGGVILLLVVTVDGYEEGENMGKMREEEKGRVGIGNRREREGYNREREGLWKERGYCVNECMSVCV